MGYKPKKVDKKKVTERLSKQSRTQETTRGKRRLSFAQAYSRRTTDSSRARVLELYGKKKPPKGYGGKAHYPTPVRPDSLNRVKPLTPSGYSRGRKRNLTGGSLVP